MQWLAVYLLIMSHLPNHIYYTQLAHMDHDKLWSTVPSILLYGGLELLSFVLLDWSLRKKLQLSSTSLLAFVLESQWKMMQSKLVLWVFYVIQSSLEHYGKPAGVYYPFSLLVDTDPMNCFFTGADYSFQFRWLHKHNHKHKHAM